MSVSDFGADEKYFFSAGPGKEIFKVVKTWVNQNKKVNDSDNDSNNARK